MSELVLLSGGIDSALAWHMARDYGPATGLFFDYGQAHAEAERSAMLLFAQRHQIPVVAKRLPTLRKSNSVVFAGRNLLMIAAAIPIAHEIKATRVWIGCNASDRKHFPDCRPQFLRAVYACARAYNVIVMAPLQNMTKRQVVLELYKRDDRPDDLWSCYAPRGEASCGECLACTVRAKAGA